MKKFRTFFILAALVLAGASCSNGDEAKITVNPIDSTVTGTCIASECPNWERSTNLGYTSMTVVIDEKGVPTTLSEGDKLAAFVGSECRGIAVPFKTYLGKMHVNLLVRSSSANTEGNNQVEIRYYSATEGGIYTAEPISYSDDAKYGNPNEGYKLTWK